MNTSKEISPLQYIVTSVENGLRAWHQDHVGAYVFEGDKRLTRNCTEATICYTHGRLHMIGSDVFTQYIIFAMHFAVPHYQVAVYDVKLCRLPAWLFVYMFDFFSLSCAFWVWRQSDCSKHFHCRSLLWGRDVWVTAICMASMLERF